MENKTTRLSHSAASKFQFCPTAYRMHYIDKLRTVTTTGALLFGSAIDVALTALVKGEANIEDVFEKAWTNVEINDGKTYLPTCTKVVYSDSDGDKDLLHPHIKLELQRLYGKDWEEDLNKIIQKKKIIGFKFIKKEEKELLNFYNWHCLYRKGILMINAVRKEILPHFKEILGTQVYVELKNDNNDTVIGYADLVAKWKNNPKPIVFDWKTSSIDYEEDSVLVSPQLSLYVHALSSQFEDTRQAGFIVLHKRIIKNKKKVCASCGYDGSGARHKTCSAVIEGKRCDGAWTETIDPQVKIQVIINEISKTTEDLILDNIDSINVAIKTGNFTRNLGSCISHFGKCSFYDKCYRGSDDGLVKLK